jgi:hypothetical protein
MKILSSNLIHQYKHRNNILFKFGDIGEKYYIILNGAVDILIPKWRNVKLSKKQYFVLLSRFKIYEENQLLTEMLQRNRNILDLSIQDIEEFIEYEIYLEKERKEKITQISQVKNLLALNPNVLKRNSMFINNKDNRNNKNIKENKRKNDFMDNFTSLKDKNDNNNINIKEKYFTLNCLRNSIDNKNNNNNININNPFIININNTENSFNNY